MKKLAKLFGFALVAMVLFAGCGKKDKWKGVDQDVTEIKFSDGEWEAEACYTASAQGASAEVVNFMVFEVKDEKVTVKEGYTETSATGMDTQKKELDADDLKDLKDMPQATFKVQLKYFCLMSGIAMPEDTKFKTNEDKTKYRYYDDKTENVETEITFVKQ